MSDGGKSEERAANCLSVGGCCDHLEKDKKFSCSKWHWPGSGWGNREMRPRVQCLEIIEEIEAKLFGDATLLAVCGRDNVCVRQPCFSFP